MIAERLLPRARLVAIGAIAATASCSPSTVNHNDPEAQHVWAGATALWYRDDTARLDREDRVLRMLLDERCAVRKLGPAPAAFFTAAANHADRVIAGGAFETLLRAKTTWQATTDSSARILDRVRRTGVEINVFLYTRDDSHPCRGNDVVGDHTNAFTPMAKEGAVHLLFLHEPYVERVMRANETRSLAGTIVHESLHSMGYTHEGLEPGSERYNNSVPGYLQCVIQHWSDLSAQAWAAENCHKATADQAKDPG